MDEEDANEYYVLRSAAPVRSLNESAGQSGNSVQTSTSYKKDVAAELTEAMGKSSLKSGSHRPTLVGT